MLNGWHKGERTGSGTIVWKAREMMARGEIDYEGLPIWSPRRRRRLGYCNTMGTASTMNSLAEALGMQLARFAAIPAPYRERRRCPMRPASASSTWCWEDLRPSRS